MTEQWEDCGWELPTIPRAPEKVPVADTPLFEGQRASERPE